MGVEDRGSPTGSCFLSRQGTKMFVKTYPIERFSLQKVKVLTSTDKYIYIS